MGLTEWHRRSSSSGSSPETQAGLEIWLLLRTGAFSSYLSSCKLNLNHYQGRNKLVKMTDFYNLVFFCFQIWECLINCLLFLIMVRNLQVRKCSVLLALPEAEKEKGPEFAWKK